MLAGFPHATCSSAVSRVARTLHLVKLTETDVTGASYHELQRDGITNRTTYKHFKHESTYLHAHLPFMDVRVMYEHRKGKILMLPNNRVYHFISNN